MKKLRLFFEWLIFQQVYFDDAVGNEPCPFLQVGDIVEYGWKARIVLRGVIGHKVGALRVTNIESYGSVDFEILGTDDIDSCNRYWLRHVEDWRIQK